MSFRDRVSTRAAMGLAAILTGMLAACAVGPNYRPPSVAAVQPLNASDDHFSAAHPRAEWWLEFSDATLAQLEARALKGSPDIALALARVHTSRAFFSESLFNLGPRVTRDGAYDRSKESSIRTSRLLDAQRTLLEAEDDLARADLDSATDGSDATRAAR